ncbi:single-stranded DNA-binding protein [Patescibacteria group bacterium]|nr:single-stranded DNA-binding protein [Patescibacteria group bacterium]MBU4512191.1 single-stranded DNA-binding protein [Patescibacteria group bacterium]MCG2693459.1 single-stranded DNA-binding protein [Candidatus Parcubacteria bacterium]
MDLNKAMIIGRLTRDPETRTIPSGHTVTSFGLATNRVWTDAAGQKQEAVEFHNIVAWRRLAEICGQYLRKGSKIYIEGRLQTRSWDGQDGIKRYRTEIVADNMIMLDTKGANEPAPMTETPPPSPTEEPTQSEASQPPTGDEEVNVEEVPF